MPSNLTPEPLPALHLRLSENSWNEFLYLEPFGGSVPKDFERTSKTELCCFMK